MVDWTLGKEDRYICFNDEGGMVKVRVGPAKEV